MFVTLRELEAATINQLLHVGGQATSSRIQASPMQTHRNAEPGLDRCILYIDCMFYLIFLAAACMH